MVEIGAARPEELDTMLGIMCQAFRLPFEAAREVFYADPFFEIENKRVLRVDGEIVSCLTIIDTLCWLGDSVVRLGGIAGVATVPDLQRRGYGGQLLRDTVRTLKERGIILSALFPFSYGYYRKFGWELAGFAHRYLTAPANLPASDGARHVRLARPEDIPDLVRLYDGASRGKMLHCLRDANRWRYLYDHIKHRVVFSPDGTAVEGYLLYDHRPGALSGNTGDSGVLFPPTLRVLEMRASTPAARRGLTGYLATQANIGCIEYATTLEDLAGSGLLLPDSLRVANNDAVASVEIVPSVMVRVIDFIGALESLRPQWPSIESPLALIMRDETCAICAILERAENDVVHVRETAEASLSPIANRVEGDVRIWSQVIVGHCGGGDACAQGLLQFTTPTAAAYMESLFPLRTPYLPIPDHF